MSVTLAILLPVTSLTSPAGDRPSLASFWNDLPRDGKLLLSTVAIETLGTGLVLPFGFIYLHEVRGFTIETAGSLLAVPAIAGMAVVGPAGAFIDRLGARRIILAGMGSPDARQCPVRLRRHSPGGRTGPGTARRCGWHLLARFQCHDRRSGAVRNPAALLRDQLHPGQPGHRSWRRALGDHR